MQTQEDSAPAIEFANGVRFEVPKSDETARTDLWVDAFDGIYRLFLDLPQIAELERKCGRVDAQGNQHPRGIFAIYGAVAKGRYELEGRAVGFAVEGIATQTECLETMRLALIGGGNAIVNGKLERIGSQRARELVETYLAPGPIEESWNLAFLMLHTAIHGRAERPEEAGTRSRTAVPPAGHIAETVEGVDAGKSVG